MKLTEEHYILAEKICRREYEKRFNFDFSLPKGHIQNIIFGKTQEEMKNKIIDIIKFWDELSNKYIPLVSIDNVIKTHPVKQAIYFICQAHKTAFTEKLLLINEE